MNICSGQAEESLTPFGTSCSSDTHANGASMYMEMSGTSQATAVAGGASTLVREFLREDQGISGPTSALIKAVLINGAEDLGTPDIPNSNEGWGKIDLKQSLKPSHDDVELDIAVDNNRIIQPGFPRFMPMKSIHQRVLISHWFGLMLLEALLHLRMSLDSFQIST